MAFFILDKDVASGSLRLPVDGTYGTREEALAALSAAVAAGETVVRGQVFVLDLDTGQPVLMMPAPVVTAAQPQEPVVETPPVIESEPELEPGPEPQSESVLEPEPEVRPEPVVIAESDVVELEDTPVDDGDVFAPALAGVSLADALKRATTTLEDEGIVAPDSISAEESSFRDDFMEEVETQGKPRACAEVVSSDSTIKTQIAEPMSAFTVESPEVLEAPAEWPWANVEALPDSLLVEPEFENVPKPESVDVPAAGDFGISETLITSAPPIGEDAYVPRPVILGDYMDGTPGVIAPPAAPAGDPEGVVAPAAPEVPAVEMAYEPTGELDLGSYTCDDCVYSNTCPKVGEVTPAECGTFQWRSF
ncbi:MAG: hypothetical protein RBS17_05480 [Coriobacteriia bacterium]|nr:hypothetical protein [Coriobacteriia bacterium]